ncbi:hypothetical protein IQ279_13660 [Streptomyces verrucosisporus]|uniref:hypothetical protein n=1 Tax=Streptomyces verrucosisporus TaxID=1695161 RepID=UPI0019CF9050|nr:hypothetical protein [Streptomyces verrucosisporus]MBN3930666.1 hypothetical protein [Streptomyces verrucosisporus]
MDETTRITLRLPAILRTRPVGRAGPVRRSPGPGAVHRLEVERAAEADGAPR